MARRQAAAKAARDPFRLHQTDHQFMPDLRRPVERDRDFSSARTPHRLPSSVLDCEGQPVLDIGNDDHWEVIKSPKRLRVLEGIRSLGECTIPHLTAHLNETKKSLYYHVTRLLGAGLIEEAGVCNSGTPRDAVVYRSTLQDGVIPFAWDPGSELETRRVIQARDRWGRLMLDAYHQNRKAITGKPTRQRTIAKMNWLSVTPAQRDQIESLFEQLRAVIEEAEMNPPGSQDERIGMQYSLWLIDDAIGFGPLPALRPVRKGREDGEASS